MRLTNKLVNGKGYTYKYNDFGCFDKLGQLEDIEEEFEIDDIEDLRDRLTKYKFLANHNMSCVDVDAYNLMLEDLNRYHSIEKELGIDLLTLFKALKDGIWTWNDEEHKEHFFEKPLGLTKFIMENKYDEIETDTYRLVGVDYYELKDYGKTWALTKEELL